MKGKHWGLFLTVACVISLSLELFSYAYGVVNSYTEKSLEISVDKVPKPVYPVGTFEYEVKRTQ